MSQARQLPDDVTTTLAFGVAPSKSFETGSLHALRRNKPPRDWVARCGIPMGGTGRDPLAAANVRSFDAGDRNRLCCNCAESVDEIALLGAHVEQKRGGNAYLVFDEPELFEAVHCPK